MVDYTFARFLRFSKAIAKLYIKARGNLLPFHYVEKRLEICRPCPWFTGKGCKQCGCNCNEKDSYFNKIAYPTERCPDDPPRWVEIDLSTINARTVENG